MRDRVIRLDHLIITRSSHEYPIRSHSLSLYELVLVVFCQSYLVIYHQFSVVTLQEPINPIFTNFQTLLSHGITHLNIFELLLQQPFTDPQNLLLLRNTLLLSQHRLDLGHDDNLFVIGELLLLLMRVSGVFESMDSPAQCCSAHFELCC